MSERETTQGFSVKDKSACIIGCGGLGCNVAIHLAGAGIGKLLLCDFDTVSKGNLNRQFLYVNDDIGKSKCLTAKKRLSLYSEETEYIAVEQKILSENDLSFAKDCDVIILAVDNLPARKTVQSFAQHNNIPLVCGGIDGFYGTVYLYIPGVSPCPDCAGLNSAGKAVYNVSVAAGIIGSAQAALALKYLICEDDKISGKLLIYDTDRFDTLEIRASKNCFICNESEI